MAPRFTKDKRVNKKSRQTSRKVAQTKRHGASLKKTKAIPQPLLTTHQRSLASNVNNNDNTNNNNNPTPADPSFFDPKPFSPDDIHLPWKQRSKRQAQMSEQFSDEYARSQYDTYRLKSVMAGEAEARDAIGNQTTPDLKRIKDKGLDEKLLNYLPDIDLNAPNVVRLSTAADFNLDFELELEWQKVTGEAQFKDNSSLAEAQRKRFEAVFEKMAQAKRKEFQLERTHLEAVKQKFEKLKTLEISPALPDEIRNKKAADNWGKEDEELQKQLKLAHADDDEIIEDYYGYGDILREMYESTPSTSILNIVEAQQDPDFDTKTEEMINDMIKETQAKVSISQHDIKELIKANPRVKHGSIRMSQDGNMILEHEPLDVKRFNKYEEVQDNIEDKKYGLVNDTSVYSFKTDMREHREDDGLEKFEDPKAHLTSVRVVPSTDLEYLARNQALLTETGRADRFDNFYDDDEKRNIKLKLYKKYNDEFWVKQKEIEKNSRVNFHVKLDAFSSTDPKNAQAGTGSKPKKTSKEDAFDRLIKEAEHDPDMDDTKADDVFGQNFKFDDNDLKEIDADTKPYYAREDEGEFLDEHLKQLAKESNMSFDEYKHRYKLRKDPTHVEKTVLDDEGGDWQNDAEAAVRRMRKLAAAKPLQYTPDTFKAGLEEVYQTEEFDPTKSQYKLGETVDVRHINFETQLSASVNAADMDFVIGRGEEALEFNKDGLDDAMLNTPDSFKKLQEEREEQMKKRAEAAKKLRLQRQMGGDESTTLKEEIKSTLDERDKEFFNEETGELYTSRPATKLYAGADKNYDPELVPETLHEMDQMTGIFMETLLDKGRDKGGIGPGRDKKKGDNNEEEDIQARAAKAEKLQPLPRFTAQAGISKDQIQMHPMDYINKFVKKVHPDLFIHDKYNVLDDKISVTLYSQVRTVKDEYGHVIKQYRYTTAQDDEYQAGVFKKPDNIRYYQVDSKIINKNNTTMLSTFNTLLDYYKKLSDMTDMEKNDPFAEHLNSNNTPKKQLLTFFLLPNSKKPLRKPHNVKKGLCIWDEDGNEVMVNNLKPISEMTAAEKEQEEYEKNRVKMAQKDTMLDGEGVNEGEFIDEEALKLMEQKAQELREQKAIEEEEQQQKKMGTNNNNNDDGDKQNEQGDGNDSDDDIQHIRTVRVWYNPPNPKKHTADPRDLTNAYMLSLERCMVEVLTALEADIPSDIRSRWRTEISNSFLSKEWGKKESGEVNKLASIFKVGIDDLNAPSDDQMHQLFAKSPLAYIHMFPYANQQTEADFRSETHPRHHLFNALMIGGFVNFDKKLTRHQRFVAMRSFNALVAESYQHLDCHRWWARKISAHDIAEQKQILDYIQSGNDELRAKGRQIQEEMEAFPDFDLDRNNVWPNTQRGEHFSLHFSVHFGPEDQKPRALIVSSEGIVMKNKDKRTSRVDMLAKLLRGAEREFRGQDPDGPSDDDDDDNNDDEPDDGVDIKLGDGKKKNRRNKKRSNHDYMRGIYLNTIADGMYGVNKDNGQNNNNNNKDNNTNNDDDDDENFPSSIVLNPPMTPNDACLQVVLPVGMQPDKVQEFLLGHAYVLYDEWKLLAQTYRDEIRDVENKTLPPGTQLFTLNECMMYFSTLKTKHERELVIGKLASIQPALAALLEFFENMSKRKYKKMMYRTDSYGKPIVPEPIGPSPPGENDEVVDIVPEPEELKFDLSSLLPQKKQQKKKDQSSNNNGDDADADSDDDDGFKLTYQLQGEQDAKLKDTNTTENNTQQQQQPGPNEIVDNPDYQPGADEIVDNPDYKPPQQRELTPEEQAEEEQRKKEREAEAERQEKIWLKKLHRQRIKSFESVPIGSPDQIEKALEIRKLPELKAVIEKLDKHSLQRRRIRMILDEYTTKEKVDEIWPTFVKTKALVYTFEDLLHYTTAQFYKELYPEDYESLRAQLAYLVQSLEDRPDMRGIDWEKHKLELGGMDFIRYNINQKFDKKAIFATHHQNITGEALGVVVKDGDNKIVDAEQRTNRAERRQGVVHRHAQPEASPGKKLAHQILQAQKQKEKTKLESLREHNEEVEKAIQARKHAREKVRLEVFHAAEKDKIKNISMNLQLHELQEREAQNTWATSGKRPAAQFGAMEIYTDGLSTSHRGAGVGRRGGRR